MFTGLNVLQLERKCILRALKGNSTDFTHQSVLSGLWDYQPAAYVGKKLYKAFCDFRGSCEKCDK